MLQQVEANSYCVTMCIYDKLKELFQIVVKQWGFQYHLPNGSGVNRL